MAKRFLWVLLLTVLWPLLHLLVFVLRFGRLSEEMIADARVFLPMGFISAVVLVTLLALAAGRASKIGAVAGYSLAAPFAFIGSLFSGLILEPWIGTLLYGALPLIVGTVLGYFAGLLWERVRT